MADEMIVNELKTTSTVDHDGSTSAWRARLQAMMGELDVRARELVEQGNHRPAGGQTGRQDVRRPASDSGGGSWRRRGRRIAPRDGSRGACGSARSGERSHRGLTIRFASPPFSGSSVRRLWGERFTRLCQVPGRRPGAQPSCCTRYPALVGARPPRVGTGRRDFCETRLLRKEITETMSNLVAIVYPDEQTAPKAWETLQELQKGYNISLEDACYIIKDQQGKVSLHQMVSTAGAGAAGGAFWGFLIGLLFFVPIARPRPRGWTWRAHGQVRRLRHRRQVR